MKKRITTEKAIELFEKNKGILRTSEALKLGIHPKTLYHMRDRGLLEQISRGIYRLADLPSFENVDLVTVSLAIPKGVICLISALSFHGLTTQIPRQVDVACHSGIKQPKIDYPPIRVFRFSKRSFESGIETHQIDGVSLRIYSPAKTVVDCFKFRNRIGLDVAIESLKAYWKEKKGNVDMIMKYASNDRMSNVIRPYVESIIHE